MLPGFLLAVFYVVMILLQVKIDPDATPQYKVEIVSWGKRLRLVFTNLVPMGLVVFMVTGLIILGVATPTEAAAFGVLGVFILAVAFRTLSREVIVKSLTGTLRISGMVLIIVLASSSFSQILVISGATRGLVQLVSEFEISPLAILIVMFAILLVLGMLMDQVSMMLITVPIFFPLAQAMGFDLIWFAMIVLLALECQRRSKSTPLAGVKMHHLMRFSPALAVVPVVHRRDPRCFV